jgi:signal transduction histidine kinase
VRNEWPSKIALALPCSLAICLPAFGQTPATDTLPTLTSIKAVRALSQDEGGRSYPVHIKGIVTHVDERYDHSLIIHDGKLGQFIVPPANPESAGSWLTLRRGDVVEIFGRTERGGFAPNVQPQSVRVVSTSPLPAPKRISFGSLLTGRHDCDYIEITGVVQRTWLSSDPNVRTLFADVAVEEGVVRAFFWDYSPADLKDLIDTRVRLRGNVGTIFGRTGQVRGVSLFVGRTSDVDVLESAPDPFLRPVRPINSIYDYSTSGEVNRRTRVRGTVTAYIPGRPVELNDFPSKATFRFVRHVIYVDDGTGAARVETEQALKLTPGTVVDVAGFPAVTPAKPVIGNAIVRVVGAGEQPQPVPLEGSLVLTPEYDALLVRMQGQFLSTLRSPTQRIFVLQVAETVFDAALELDEPTAAGPLERMQPGSVVAVTGVYSYQWGPAPSFRLFLRSPADLTVLSAAPWWTMRHTAVMVGLLALVAVAGGSWARMSGQRKRQEYQAVLNERSRLGRELHDTLEQGLAGIGLQLEAVAGSMQSSPDTARQALDVAKQMLLYSQEEARRSVMDLRSQALESRDLAGALTDVARQMTLGTRALAAVRVEGVPRRLDAAEEHHLLRIGLEALTNAVKHADARSVEIILAFRPEAVELIVQDDGCGLGSNADESPHGCFGLLGIRERVDKIGGLLEVSGRPGAGTRLVVTIPAARRDVRTAVPSTLGESWTH